MTTNGLAGARSNSLFKLTGALIDAIFEVFIA
jgi:hypothetical protein